MASDRMPLTVGLGSCIAVDLSLPYLLYLVPLVLRADQAQAANRSGYPHLGKSNRGAVTLPIQTHYEIIYSVLNK